jgi:hypothetical protein
MNIWVNWSTFFPVKIYPFLKTQSKNSYLLHFFSFVHFSLWNTMTLENLQSLSIDRIGMKLTCHHRYVFLIRFNSSYIVCLDLALSTINQYAAVEKYVRILVHRIQRVQVKRRRDEIKLLYRWSNYVLTIRDARKPNAIVVGFASSRDTAQLAELGSNVDEVIICSFD